MEGLIGTFSDGSSETHSSTSSGGSARHDLGGRKRMRSTTTAGRLTARPNPGARRRNQTQAHRRAQVKPLEPAGAAEACRSGAPQARMGCRARAPGSAGAPGRRGTASRVGGAARPPAAAHPRMRPRRMETTTKASGCRARGRSRDRGGGRAARGGGRGRGSDPSVCCSAPRHRRPSGGRGAHLSHALPRLFLRRRSPQSPKLAPSYLHPAMARPGAGHARAGPRSAAGAGRIGGTGRRGRSGRRPWPGMRRR